MKMICQDTVTSILKPVFVYLETYADKVAVISWIVSQESSRRYFLHVKHRQFNGFVLWQYAESHPITSYVVRWDNPSKQKPMWFALDNI